MLIVFIEYILFKRTKGLKWDRWEDKSYLPVGWATETAFLVN